ncbi:MAG: hypothetical protein GWN58_28585 [Anaerolineae bacterium]|nr:hypothetical protein [Anaerolineae bacterium]
MMEHPHITELELLTKAAAIRRAVLDVELLAVQAQLRLEWFKALELVGARKEHQDGR